MINTMNKHSPQNTPKNMEYQDLQSLIQQHINQSDTDAIIAMITPDNVDSVFRCSNKPGNTGVDAQRLTDPLWFLDQYEALKTGISSETLASEVDKYFTPENVLIAGFGQEYEEALQEAEALATELGAANPATEAEEIVQEQLIFEKIQSNKRPDEC